NVAITPRTVRQSCHSKDVARNLDVFCRQHIDAVPPQGACEQTVLKNDIVTHCSGLFSAALVDVIWRRNQHGKIYPLGDVDQRVKRTSSRFKNSLIPASD